MELYHLHGKGSFASSLHSPSDMYWGQLGGCLECLDVGTTTVVDHAHLNYSPEHSKQITFLLEEVEPVSQPFKQTRQLQPQYHLASDLSSVTAPPVSLNHGNRLHSQAIYFQIG
jgi:hypothetical protein